MHITHISDRDFFGPDKGSGTSYWMSRSFALDQEIQLHDMQIDASEAELTPLGDCLLWCKKNWHALLQKPYYSPEILSRSALCIAKKVKKQLSSLKTDAILTSVTPITSAYLETDIPIIYWTDAVFAALSMRFFHPDLTEDGHRVTQAALRNARLLIFSTAWAARTAVEFYGINKDKIKIVPFGANIDISHTDADVRNMIAARTKKCIKLLFVGKHWYRKGGDIVLDVANALHAAHHAVELTIVGCELNKPLPSYVNCLGYLSKKSKRDVEELKRLYQESHLFFLPSRTEAYGIAFCEASAYGLPSIASSVGGIPEVVRDGENGKTFSLETTVQSYCDYIINTLSNYDAYTELALSSFNTYQKRLNWLAACQQVKRLIAELI